MNDPSIFHCIKDSNTRVTLFVVLQNVQVERSNNKKRMIFIIYNYKLYNCKFKILEYFGHIMRHPEKYDLLHLIMQGKIESRRGPGRRRTFWLKNLRQWFGKTTIQLFRAAANKVIIANMIANMIANDR